jgi:hypothetical protein
MIIYPFNKSKKNEPVCLDAIRVFYFAQYTGKSYINFYLSLGYEMLSYNDDNNLLDC